MPVADMKHISVYNFLEIANSTGAIASYLQSLPEIEQDFFTQKEEQEILQTQEFQLLENSIESKFVGKL